MTELNPYAEPDDIDADILDSRVKGRHHNLDGQVCEACGVVHSVTSNEEIPSEVMDKVSDLLDDMPQGTRASEIIITKTSYKTKVLRDFIQFSRNLHRVNPYGPLLRSMAEILDEMTGGEVERRWHVYQVEQELVIMHMIMKTVNNMVEEFHAQEHQETEVAKLLEMIETSTMDRLRDASDRYRQRAEEANVVIDHQLIETGIFSEGDDRRSRFHDHTMAEGFQADLKRLMGDDDEEDSDGNEEELFGD